MTFPQGLRLGWVVSLLYNFTSSVWIFSHFSLFISLGFGSWVFFVLFFGFFNCRVLFLDCFFLLCFCFGPSQKERIDWLNDIYFFTIAKSLYSQKRKYFHFIVILAFILKDSRIERKSSSYVMGVGSQQKERPNILHLLLKQPMRLWNLRIFCTICM